jgi:hypothetical protein
VQRRSPLSAVRPTVPAMPQLQVDPEVLEGSARAVGVERRAADLAAGELGRSFRAIALALPGSQTAGTAELAGGSLVAAVRSLAAELAVLAGALAAAATGYLVVEDGIVAGVERAGRWPA